MKKVFLLFTFIIGTLSLFAQFKNNSVGQIPIIAWGGVPPGESTVSRYSELLQSGVTHNISLFNNVDELAVAMEAAKKTGVKMIIYCPELRKEPEKIVNRFKDHPSLAGYLLYDEPQQNEFPKVQNLIKRIQAIDKDHFCYVNLLAVNFSSKSLSAKSYEKTVEQFVNDNSVPVISFDFYPIIKNSFGNQIMSGQWYENLEFFSKEAHNIGKPFWAFALTLAMGDYPIPTIEGIRLQVFSNLAYGAQGIQYFTYWTPTPRQGKLGNFHNAPIDLKTKKKTNVYNYIQEINTEIKALSPVFLGAKVVSVSHTGNKIPSGTTRLKSLPEVIRKFNTDGLGAIVSILNKGDMTYLVVVNRDFKKPMTLTIEGDDRLIRIMKNGKSIKASASDSKISVPPGDVVVFGW